jgi:hypothetical protein
MITGIIKPGASPTDELIRIPITRENREEVGGFDLIPLPKTIKMCRRSPTSFELSWLHNELTQLNAQSKIDRVLEYSGGITTWVTYDSIKPSKYVCVEDKRFVGIFKPVTDIYPGVDMVHNWLDIPDDVYDLVFVDGSSCMPAELKSKYKVRGQVHRKQALLYAEQFMRVGSLVVFHDWGHPIRKGGWRAVRNYLQSSEDYEFVKAFQNKKKGFGIFRKIK